MTPDLILPSPAKLNLFLHIVGRRDDGYHELQTLFQFLDYGDDLSFTLTPGEPGARLAEPVTGVNDEDNLIIRAARALLERARCELPESPSALTNGYPWAAVLAAGAPTPQPPCWDSTISGDSS